MIVSFKKLNWWNTDWFTMKDCAKVLSKCKHFLSMILAIFLYPKYQESVIQPRENQKVMSRPLDGAWSGASQARVSVKTLTESQPGSRQGGWTQTAPSTPTFTPPRGRKPARRPDVPQMLHREAPSLKHRGHNTQMLLGLLTRPGERPAPHSLPAWKSIGRKRGKRVWAAGRG